MSDDRLAHILNIVDNKLIVASGRDGNFEMIFVKRFVAISVMFCSKKRFKYDEQNDSSEKQTIATPGSSSSENTAVKITLLA